MKIVQDFGFEVAKNNLRPSPPHENLVKIVQDFGFEVTKNTPPPQWKLVKIIQDFGFEVSKNTPLKMKTCRNC